MTVVMIFVVATTLTAAIAIGLQYYFSESLATSAATRVYTTAANGVTQQFNAGLERNASIIRLLSENPVFLDPEREQAQLETFRSILAANPQLYGMYVGRGDGSFLELINLHHTDVAHAVLTALPSDRWVVVRVEGNQREFVYLDEQMNIRASRTEPTDYDVRNRDWYTQALASGTTELSEPYLFAQLNLPGQTTSRAVRGSDIVLGLDRTMASLEAFLREQKLSSSSEMFVFHPDGGLVASTLDNDAAGEIPVPEFELSKAERALVAEQGTLRVSNEMDWPPFDYALLGEPQGYAVDVIRLIAEMTGLKVRFVNGLEWTELVAEFREGKLEVLQPIGISDANRHWGEEVDAFAELPFVLVTRDDAAPIRNIDALAGKTVAIPGGWAVAATAREYFPEIKILPTDSPADSLRRVRAGEAFATLDNEPILRYVQRHYFLDGLMYHTDIDFNSVSMPDDLQMFVQPGETALAALLNRAIAAIGPPQREALAAKWLDHGLQEESESITAGTVPSRALIEMAGDPLAQGQLLPVEFRGQAHYAYTEPLLKLPGNRLHLGVLVPRQSVLGPFNEKVMFSLGITAGFLLLLVPLSWSFASPIVRPIKQLDIENDKVRDRRYDEVQRAHSRIKEIDELSESMVEMVEAIQAHEQAQRELMDSFIQLIAQAIDDKSAYTGGHCERVPELALMLADSASRSDLPAFRDFDLSDRERWREYRIAAWLHDCGKITTPEHVVDKGSKLETIYNRIHEVRMRFEVLWRDAEIAYLKGLLENPADEPRLRETLECERKRLQDDFRFVADCNVGGEFLDPDAQQRLRDIARITWQRHFDDRLGLSPVDELRLPDTPPPALPATEPLLADKPEHIIQRDRSTDYPPEFGIRMDVPEHLYNLGEVYNLSVSRGTLTAEDRFKINEHMISTIKMLESLPFPEELKNVPRYASTHHETMKGSGYPRKLPGEALSIPERLLAVADVFEALTASDRPYKKAKPVSVAIDILHKMVLDDHIDRDSFELFLREGVYRRYAERFLAPEQIDEVDVAQYLSRLDAA